MSLTRKLVLSFLTVSLVGALLVLLITRWMTVREFNQLIIEQTQTAFIERAASYYTNNGSWQGIAFHFQQAPRPPYLNQPRPSAEKTPQQPIFAFSLVDQNGIVILPGGSFTMREQLPEEIIDQAEPVLVYGETVGYVIASGEPPKLIPQEQQYIDRTNRAILVATGGAVLVALVLGVVLARGLTGPLRDLTEAIRTISKGQLGRQVPVQSQDEIGELAQAFNQMSAELEGLTIQRQQMTADIAHDLRTPLTVIGGYVESMLDGVLEATPERLEVIYNEVGFLQRLVEDLRTLSLAEAGQLTLRIVWISPRTLLEQLKTTYQHVAAQQEVALNLLVGEDIPEIQVDPDRIVQVLGNLVSNALRHTSSGGVINLQIDICSERLAGSGKRMPDSSLPSSVDKPVSEKRILITVSDTGEGITPEVLPNIFNRFYRGDQARQSQNGESGLGLAISKSIIDLHGGELWAHSDGKGKGSTFKICLPIVHQPNN